jgi:hypothetical protein
MNLRIEDRIGEFFVRKKSDLFNYEAQKESDLLISLKFAEELELDTDNSSENDLFGWGSLKSDFKPKTDENTIIEVKYVRVTKNSKDGNCYNEYDVKNGLSQILEQALCKRVQNAIFVVIDAGRAKSRDWNEIEGMFISMFKQNPFNIRLSIVRIKFDIDLSDINLSTVTYKVI